MEENLQNENQESLSTDTCGGVPKPSVTKIGYEWICDDGKWVEIQLP